MNELSARPPAGLSPQPVWPIRLFHCVRELDPDFWDMNSNYSHRQPLTFDEAVLWSHDWHELSWLGRFTLLFRTWHYACEDGHGTAWVYKIQNKRVYLFQESGWIGGLP